MRRASPSAAVLATLGLLAGAVLGTAVAAVSEDAQPAWSFEGSREEIQRFLDLYESIELTAEQEALRVEALTPLPAPCCKEFSAATCCCECNLSRTTWGLAKHLIVEQGLGVEEVREAVLAWHEAINPAGFSGDSCFTGGCGRSFRHNGCGGMRADHLVH